MSETKLLNCPFCGEAGAPQERLGPGSGIAYVQLTTAVHEVRCRACFSSGPHTNSKETAIAAWNHRASGWQGPSQQASSGWISVEERLPGYEAVLAYDPAKCACFKARRRKGQQSWKQLPGGWLLWHVTHWQPLPSPPTPD